LYSVDRSVIFYINELSQTIVVISGWWNSSACDLNLWVATHLAFNYIYWVPFEVDQIISLEFNFLGGQD
jgi:hypothetical protein